MLILLGELGANLTKVVVTEIRDRTYYAELHLTTRSRRQSGLRSSVRRDRPRRSAVARRCSRRTP